MVDKLLKSVYYLWINYPHFMLDVFWREFLTYLSAEFAKKQPVIFLFLKQLKPTTLNNDRLVLSCTNQGLKTFFDKKIRLLEEELSRYAKKSMAIELTVLSKAKKTDEPPLLSFQPSTDDLLTRSGFLNKYSFENFAVSSSNQIAFAAAQAVVNAPGSAYNPLFVYGGVGVGKTHLAQAVGRKIFELDQNKRVFFCPGDLFTNELIESIREKSTARFRKKYRYLNLLVVDDIQFIAGKQTVQEEFFHTFNSIASAGGQIILTSDRHPSAIKNLEDRLRSRFSGGLIIDIQPPDFELRTAILLIKAREKNIPIDIEAAKLIAEKITDTRSLEGTLLTIYANNLGVSETVSVEAVSRFFRKSEQKISRRFYPEDIIKSVALFYNLKPSKLRGETKESEVALPRQVAMYVLRKHLNLKLSQIAHFLNRKDHTTVIHGVDKVNRLLTQDPVFKQRFNQLVESLGFST